jgi:hypothetical protein
MATLAHLTMNWISQHQQELQAISGLAISFLTLILIIVTGFYATANWRTMRLMDADVRFKLKPIPHLGLAPAEQWNDPQGQTWILTIRCQHAPMVLIGVSIRFSIGNGKEFEHFHTFNRKTINEQDSGQQDKLHIKLPAPAQTWILDLYYRDLSGFLDYATVFSAQGFVSDLTTIDRKTLWNRVRFWIGTRAIRKCLRMK